MLCQICHKNPAVIHAQEICNGKSRFLHLCLQCAGKQPEFAPMLKQSGLPGMLKDMMQGKVPSALTNKKPEETQLTEEEKKLSCRHCGWTFAQFKKTGLMGCAECYHAFDGHYAAVLPRTKKNQAVTVKQDATQKMLIVLQKGLQESIQREEFEQAAELRDRIAELKGHLSAGEKRS